MHCCVRRGSSLPFKVCGTAMVGIPPPRHDILRGIYFHHALRAVLSASNPRGECGRKRAGSKSFRKKIYFFHTESGRMAGSRPQWGGGLHSPQLNTKDLIPVRVLCSIFICVQIQLDCNDLFHNKSKANGCLWWQQRDQRNCMPRGEKKFQKSNHDVSSIPV